MAGGAKGYKVRISNSGLNCYGSRVLTSGIDFEQYKRNPVLLWMHRRGDADAVIGRVNDIAVEDDDLVGYLEFDEIGETSKMVAAKWKKGTLRMVSANLDIIEESDSAEYLLPGQTAFTVTRSKLTEVSVVDIGGNDDALVMLMKNGERVALNNERGERLPVLRTIITQSDKMNELQKIAIKLGLPETATEQEIHDAISVALGYKAENERLTAELETLRLAGITGLVDGAIAARKIGADKKEHFIELGKKVGVDSLKLTFESMSVQVKPVDITGQGNKMRLDAPDASGWKKLSDVPPEKIMELRENDKDTYVRLYKAEYGIECEIN